MSNLYDTLPESPQMTGSGVNGAARKTAPKQDRLLISLAAVFGRIVEQGRQLAGLSAQLPDMKERINWLIASYYEDSQESQSIRERLEHQEADLASLTAAVRDLRETQAQCQQTMDQLLRILEHAPSAPVPAGRRWGK